MIARRSLIIVSTQILIRFFGWIGLFVLAKLWGGFAPEALGTIGFAMAFVALFTFIGDLGFSAAHIKRISEGKDLGECVGTYFTVKFLLVGLMSLILIISVLLVEHDPLINTVIWIFIAYYIFTSLLQIPISTFEATKKIVKRQITLITENLVKVPLFITVVVIGSGLVAYSVDNDNLIILLSSSYVLGIMSTFMVGLWLFRKYPIKKPKWSLFKSYFSFALPVMMLSLVSAFSVNTDKIMIGYFWDTIEVGYYFTMKQITHIFLILSGSIGIVLFPTLSNYHSNSNYEKIRNTTHLAERYISMVLIPIVIIVVIFSKTIINVMLNNSFIPASSVLIALMILCFISSISVPYTCLITGINKPSIAAKIGALICFTNIGLNFLLIPKDGLLSYVGINGALAAAIATILANTIGFFGLRFYAKKLTDIHIFNKHIFLQLFAGFIMFCFLFVFNWKLYIMSWYGLFLFSFFGLIIYLSILFIIKEFRKEDFNFFLDLFHPKEMIKYVSGEIKNK